jgi:hypothetical protein
MNVHGMVLMRTGAMKEGGMVWMWRHPERGPCLGRAFGFREWIPPCKTRTS